MLLPKVVVVVSEALAAVVTAVVAALAEGPLVAEASEAVVPHRVGNAIVVEISEHRNIAITK